MEEQLRGMTVLLVEDDDDAAFLFGMVLERAGAVVRRAAGVVEALGISKGGGAIDLVISDVHLPDGSGADVLQGWPTEHERPVALALTGDTTERTRALLEVAGFDAVVAKPASADDVIQRAAALLTARGASPQGTAKASAR